MSTRRPAGAVFHRCALQVNPHHYGKTFRGQASDGYTESHAEAIVTKAAELDVSVMAITDHNSVSGVPVFRQFAESFGITIFPEFELVSSEGIHVLCIYAPGTGQEQLGRFLGKFGILGTVPSPDLSSHRFEDVLEMVRTQRGITIAAHATTNGGLFKTLSGQARIKRLAESRPSCDSDSRCRRGSSSGRACDRREQESEIPQSPSCRRAAGAGGGQRKGRHRTRGPGQSGRNMLDQDVRREHRGPAAGVSGPKVSHRSQFPSRERPRPRRTPSWSVSHGRVDSSVV